MIAYAYLPDLKGIIKMHDRGASFRWNIYTQNCVLPAAPVGQRDSESMGIPPHGDCQSSTPASSEKVPPEKLKHIYIYTFNHIKIHDYTKPLFQNTLWRK